ncbi:hypothetical protein GYH30_044245 [Glycine max]|nr:hypothetical protein GYH30_044245 [Glycine max]
MLCQPQPEAISGSSASFSPLFLLSLLPLLPSLDLIPPICCDLLLPLRCATQIHTVVGFVQ